MSLFCFWMELCRNNLKQVGEFIRLQVFVLYISIYILTSIAIDRYLVVCHHACSKNYHSGLKGPTILLLLLRWLLRTSSPLFLPLHKFSYSAIWKFRYVNFLFHSTSLAMKCWSNQLFLSLMQDAKSLCFNYITGCVNTSLAVFPKGPFPFSRMAHGFIPGLFSIVVNNF